MPTHEIKTENIVMEVEKVNKGSIRFSTIEKNVALSNVYVSKEVPGIENAKKIKVSIEIV